MGQQFSSTFDIPQVATPTANPAASRQLLYVKSDGKVYTKNAAGAETLVGPMTKTDIGLSNVDNTTDLLKPLSTATTTALATKPTLTSAASPDYIQNLNPFGGKKLYNTEVNDGLFRAGDRFTVTGNFYNKVGGTLVGAIPLATLRGLFDGNYEAGLTIPMDQYAVININFGASGWVGYPYGNFILSYYNTSQPVATTARVFTNYAPQAGWNVLNLTNYITGATTLVQRFPNSIYQITDAEFTITAADTGGIVTLLTTIEMSLDRPQVAEMPLLNKYRAETLYSDVSWKTGPPPLVEVAKMTSAGVLTAQTITPVNAMLQSKTHGTPDTDAATTSLHHTIGAGALQAAAGNHGHVLTDANITGILPIAQVPTGTSGTTVALGNHTHVKANITDFAHTHVATTDLTATGTKDGTTFLRGDNTWAVPSGGATALGVQDEGTPLAGSYSALQFAGAGVDATNAGGGKALITIPGSSISYAAVVAETGYGQASANGVATTVARSDHTHGTPALGTTALTAAAGNHGHVLTDANITGILPIAQVPTGTSSTTVALGNHGHALTDAVITGILPIAQVPTGTTSTTVALGNHNHDTAYVGLASTQDVTGAKTFTTGTTRFGSATTTQQITLLGGATNHGVEIGRTDGTASTPFIDFHTGATAVDYDVRLLAGGGSGSSGGGTLNIIATLLQKNGVALPIDTAVVHNTGAELVSGNKTLMDHLTMKELPNTPATPSSGYNAIYAKTDGLPYWLDDGGVEQPLIAPIAPVVSLHDNPGFEGTWVNTSNSNAVVIGLTPPSFNTFWCQDQVTIQQETSQKTEGNYAVRMNRPVGANKGVRLHSSMVFGGLNPGDTVTIEADAKSTVAGIFYVDALFAPTQVSCDFFSGEPLTQAYNRPTSMTAGAAYRRCIGTFTVPTGCYWGRVSFHYDTTGDVAGTIYIDNSSSRVTPGSTGGGAVTIKDEGTTLTSAGTLMNFTGTGVTATSPAAGEVTVNIPGGIDAQHVKRNAAVTQSIPNGATTLMTFPTATESVGGITYSAGLFTIPASGRYYISGGVPWTENATGRRTVLIGKNGANSLATHDLIPHATTNHTSDVSVTADLVAGDTIGFYLYHNQGAALTTTGNVDRSFLSITLVGGTKGDQGRPGDDSSGATYRTVLNTTTGATTTAAVNLPGLEQTISSPGFFASWIVHADLDVQQIGTTQVVSGVGELLVDGVAQTAQVVAAPLASATAAATNHRGNYGQTWLLTGLAPGTHALSMTFRLTGTGNIRCTALHSTLTTFRTTLSPSVTGGDGAAVIAYGENATSMSSVSDTVMTDDSVPLSVTFTAPPSGKVKITESAYLVNTAATGTSGNVYHGYRWSGGLVRDHITGPESTAAARGQVGGSSARTYMPTEALTPGTSYTLTAQHIVSASTTGWIGNRAIMVEAVGSGPYGIHGAADTGWQDMVLQNSWVPYNAVGGTYEQPGYRRINGVVYLKGLVKNGTVAVGTILGNLPVGFRPKAQQVFAAVNGSPQSGAATTGTAHTHPMTNWAFRVDVEPDTGNVVLMSVVTGNTYLSLDNIQFAVSDYAKMAGSATGEAEEGPDTGWISDPPGVVAQTGWVLNATAVGGTGNRIRRIGNEVRLQLYVNRTGAALTGTVDGNIADTAMVQLPVGYQPSTNSEFSYRTSASFGMGNIAGPNAGSPGMVYIDVIGPGATLAVGHNVLVDTVYRLD